MKYKLCIIIPSYNHGGALENTVREALELGYPCIVVDDGSTDNSVKIIEGPIPESNNLYLCSRERNGGKGVALLDGFRVALDRGFSHALTIDADGQHDINDALQFIEKSRAEPEALILGAPIFGKEAPWERVLFREISNALAWLQTLSFASRDVLCGYRLYPLKRSADALFQHARSRGMGFDIEAVVRLCWSGAPVRNIPTHVCYPEDGVSHFHYLPDNLKISIQHVRLVLGMLIRSPRIIWRRIFSRVELSGQSYEFE